MVILASSLCDTTRKEAKGSHRQIELCVRRLFSIVTVALSFEHDALRGSTIALRVAPFPGDAVGSPPRLKYKTTSKVGHVIVDVSRTYSLATLLEIILDNLSIESHTTSILLPLTTASVSNMSYRSNKPPRCQHKPSSSCALCRRERNDLEQVGAWARESSTAMAGARSEPTDYASFVQDSPCSSFRYFQERHIDVHLLSRPNTSQPPSARRPKSQRTHPPLTRRNPATINTNRSSKGLNLTSHLFPSTLLAPEHRVAASPPPAPTVPSPTAQSQSRLRLLRHVLSQSTTLALPDNPHLLFRRNRLLL